MADHRFQPQSREEALAQELAERLGDPEGLPFYLKVARRYSETCIRSMLSRVLEYPPERIQNSRGALFNWLIRHHDDHPTPTGLLRTLAMDPGTHEMGYVVLEGTELLHFGVHSFPHRLADHQLLDDGQRFARALIDTFDPHVFVVEQTRYAHSTRSPRLNRVVTGLQRLAKRRGLLVVAYPPSRVKDTMVGDEAAPRRHVAETLVRQGYPYLEKYLTTDRRTPEHYWENMFDALALGLTAYEEIAKEKVLRTFRIASRP